MKRTLLLLGALAPGLLLAGEPGPLDPPTHSERRGLTVITSAGRLPPGASGPLVARLRRGERTACETPLAPGGEELRLELLVRGRLLPGAYALEVAPAGGGAALLAAPLQVGSAEEARAADERHAAWLRGAAGTLRDLCATLERRGSYHVALGAREPEPNADRLGRFLTDSWRPALRTAWLDLTTFRRRVILAPDPEATERLRAVCERLGARADAWEASLVELRAGRGRAPEPDPELAAAAAALVAAVYPGEDEAARATRLAGWGPGPLAEPAPAPAPGLSQGGTYRDPGLGWRLELPAGFEVTTPVRPDERLTLSGKDCKVVVAVSELPDARDPAALETALEALAWESFTSYKRLAGAPLAGGKGLRLELTAEFAGSPARVVQRSLFPSGGGRAIHLLVAWAPDAPPPACLAGLEAGFALEAP